MLIPPSERKSKTKSAMGKRNYNRKGKQLKKLAQMKNRKSTRATVRKNKQAQKDLEATYLNEQQK